VEEKMALKSIPAANLEAAITRLKAARQRAKETVERLEAKQKSIAKQVDEAHQSLSDQERDIKALEKALVVQPSLFESVSTDAQRRELADMRREAADDGITVRRLGELTKGITAVSAELQGNCAHPVVAVVPGDWEDLPNIGCIRPEELACPFCGLYEENHGKGGRRLGRGEGRKHICVGADRMARWCKEQAAGDPEKSLAIFWDFDRLPAILKRFSGK
jgi:uncharacterized protein (UPF0335 family)